MEKFLTTKDIRESLRVSEPTLWRWRRDRKLKALRLPGGGIRFREADVLQVLQVEAESEEAVPA